MNAASAIDLHDPSERYESTAEIHVLQPPVEGKVLVK
jgi:hypothetical protein